MAVAIARPSKGKRVEPSEAPEPDVPQPAWKPKESKVARLSGNDRAILDWLLTTEEARLDQQASVHQMRKSGKNAPRIRRTLRWIKVVDALVGHKIHSAAASPAVQGQRTTQNAVAVYLNRGNDWMRQVGIVRKLLVENWVNEDLRIVLRDLHDSKARPGIKHLHRLVNDLLNWGYDHVYPRLQAMREERDAVEKPEKAASDGSDTDWDDEEASLLAGPDGEDDDPTYASPAESRPTTPKPYAPDDLSWTDGPGSSEGESPSDGE